MYIEYLDPALVDETNFKTQPYNSSLFYNIEKNKGAFLFETLNNFDIAIIGVPEDRNTKNKGCAEAVNRIRENLYTLYKPFNFLKIIDLGNLKQGKTVNDTYSALKDIVTEIIKAKVVPIIIGGGQDLMYPIYQAYEKLEKTINITTIDSRFDLGFSDQEFNAESYLSKIILSKSKYLFNFTNIGYQTYYVAQEEVDLMKKLFFDAIRLGQAQSELEDTEPYLRDSDLVSIDINSVKKSDAPGNFRPSINGFKANELCQMAKYAGISDKLSTFGLFEINPEFDNRNQTSELAAQIIWHFIYGFYLKKRENPQKNALEFKKYIVKIEKTNHEIVFYNSLSTDRWWLEVSFVLKGKEKKIIVACTSKDYQTAANQDLPERWWKYYQKLH